MNTDADRHSARGVGPHLALLAVQIFFGTWPFFAKVVLRVMPSTGLVAFRVAGATLALLALQGSPRRLALDARSDYARLALYSLLGVGLNQFFFVKGLSLSTVINANLLGTLIPVVALVGSLLLGYERFRARTGVGVLLAAAGAAYLIDPLNADFGQATTAGNLMLVVSTSCYGLYIALTQRVIRRYGALTVITWVFLFANVITLPIGGYHLRGVALAGVGWHVWLSVAYIILVPTVAAYYLNAWALGRVAPSVVAIYVYLQPLIALALAPLVLGERASPRTWIAAALIFAGVALVTARRRGRGEAEAEADELRARAAAEEV